jgi:hypothetical protein
LPKEKRKIRDMGGLASDLHSRLGHEIKHYFTNLDLGNFLLSFAAHPITATLGVKLIEEMTVGGELLEYEGLKDKCQAILIKKILEMNDKRMPAEVAPSVVAATAVSTAEEEKTGNDSDCDDGIYSRRRKKRAKSGNTIGVVNEGPQKQQFKLEVESEVERFLA